RPAHDMKKLTVQIVIHIAAWLCFLLLPVLFYPRPREMDFAFFKDHYLTTFFVINNAFIIAFYYLNTYAFLPRMLDQKKFISYTILILGLMIFYTFLPRIYHSVFSSSSSNTAISNANRGGNGPRPGNVRIGSAEKSAPTAVNPASSAANPAPTAVNPASSAVNPGHNNANPAHSRPGAPRERERVRPLVNPANLVLFLLVFVFSTGIRVINQWLRSEQRNKEIANEKLKAELSFLKAQINPHFLFNTLNNIYALASAQSEHTAAAVMKLSSIMRYVLTEARNDLVPLEKEIQFTSHYIELQKMRLTDKTIIEFSICGEPLGRQIAPLLLLPFVENAFKYGISTRERSPIKILLEIKKDSLYFSICNQKHPNVLLRVSDNTGIGISNTKRRLDLFYEDRYSLQIDDKTNEFIVHLKIPV
ncbi:MAG TPA: histidine kinase, partial [Puia sp.]|nr:histidine kinase [Puia sp.]